MKVPPKPENQHSLLLALDQLGILDTPRDAVFDGITRAIADYCEVPTALISMLDSDHQHCETPDDSDARDSGTISFSAHAVLEPNELMEVPDATLDKRFYKHPLVIDEPHIRFYAGMPLLSSAGSILGTLCVIDSKPRALSLLQRQQLERVSHIVAALIESKQHDGVHIADHTIMRSVQHGIVITDAALPDYPVVYCNQAIEQMTGYHAAEIIGRNCRMWQGEDTDPAVVGQLRDALVMEQSRTVTLKNYKKDGSEFWNEITVSPVRDLGGNVTHHVGVQLDVTDKLKALDKAVQQFRESNELLQQRVRDRDAELAAANKMLQERAASKTD